MVTSVRKLTAVRGVLLHLVFSRQLLANDYLYRYCKPSFVKVKQKTDRLVFFVVWCNIIVSCAIVIVVRLNKMVLNNKAIKT